MTAAHVYLEARIFGQSKAHAHVRLRGCVGGVCVIADRARAMLWILSCLALFSLLLLYLAGFLRDLYRKVRCVGDFPPPMLPPHWFMGQLQNFGPDEHSLLRVNHYIHSKGYKATAGRLGPMVAIVSACHPDTVKPMLKEPKLRQVYDLLDPWLGKGLLTIEDGPKWHRNRHLLTPAFHYSILKGYVSVYNECLQQLFRKWDTSAKLNEPVLVFHTVSTLSLDIIFQCSFGFKSECQREGNRPAYIKAVYQLSNSIAERFFNPFYQLDWLYFLTPAGRKMKHACKVVHAHAEIIIKKRRNALGLEGSNKGLNPGSESQDIFNHITKSRHLDFLDILLTAVDDDGVGLTDTEIRNEVDTFMFEGHDTTTSGMSWTLYCLAKHPQHQEKVREEVRRVLNGRESLEYEDLKELKYTQWCIKEAMRLYPPVILIFREASRDMEIDGIKVPKGVWLGIPTYHLHHNPTIWPDPEKFDPLRFEPSNAEGRDPYAYLAFSAGSRNCIGQNFAINEEKVVVASIVNRYRLSIVEDHVVEMLPVIVLRAKYDIKLHLEPLLD